jgi:hypothetical protein
MLGQWFPKSAPQLVVRAISSSAPPTPLQINILCFTENIVNGPRTRKFWELGYGVTHQLGWLRGLCKD